MAPPQAFISSYAPRIRSYGNSLLIPVIPPVSNLTPAGQRTTKRGTTIVNYAEDGYDDDDFSGPDGPKRPTGLRSLRRDDSMMDKQLTADKIGKELKNPVQLQGIWRDWMGRPRFGRTDLQQHAQDALPVTLIPIRIDLEIPAFTPHPALPLPANAADYGIDPQLPAYTTPPQMLPSRLQDVFLWNLHETLITPDQFALCLVHDLDLRQPAHMASQISKQIRSQLEEYAGVALHPLFHTVPTNGASRQIQETQDEVSTPIPQSTALPGVTTSTNGHVTTNGVTADAELVQSNDSEVLNPDDTYRCIINININLLNRLYTDRFEWSLLHPPGTAEIFAKHTCADLGLSGEWVPVMTHAIYEAVLKLKKEACDSGGLVGGGEIENLSLEGQQAGWRYDIEGLADEWEPTIEELSREEIEKREKDRDRTLRSLRRTMGKYTSTTGMAGGTPQAGGLFDAPDPETPMGRGERSKKKRRWRSLSPVGRSGTPGDRMTPDNAMIGYGGGQSLSDADRYHWRCSHCKIFGTGVWAVRDGPKGPRTLCNNCGLIYERDRKLPLWALDLHVTDMPLGKD